MCNSGLEPVFWVIRNTFWPESKTESGRAPPERAKLSRMEPFLAIIFAVRSTRYLAIRVSKFTLYQRDSAGPDIVSMSGVGGQMYKCTMYIIQGGQPVKVKAQGRQRQNESRSTEDAEYTDNDSHDEEEDGEGDDHENYDDDDDDDDAVGGNDDYDDDGDDDEYVG